MTVRGFSSNISIAISKFSGYQSGQALRGKAPMTSSSHQQSDHFIIATTAITPIIP
jgi:hypothetical protein